MLEQLNRELAAGLIKKVCINRLQEHSAKHIIPPYCNLPVSYRSLVDRYATLGSFKPKISFPLFRTENKMDNFVGNAG
jgi:hypothetical protein